MTRIKPQVIFIWWIDKTYIRHYHFSKENQQIYKPKG